jgi:general secretion pathway protein C
MLWTQIIAFLKQRPWLVWFVLMCLSALLAAQTVNAVVAYKLRVIPSLSDLKQTQSRKNIPFVRESTFSAIASRNLLDAEREDLSPESEEALQNEEEEELNENDIRSCSAAIEVRGTMVVDNEPTWSVAVVYVTSERETKVVSANEGANEIGNELKVIEVRPGAIILKNGGHYEMCPSPESKAMSPGASGASEGSDSATSATGISSEGIEKVGEDKYVVQRSRLNDIMSNLSQVSTQARLVPSFKEGKPNGFKIFAIRESSIFGQLGLKNGDLILGVNGYTLDSPDKALMLYQKLQSTDSWSVDIERRGQKKTIDAKIAN